MARKNIEITDRESWLQARLNDVTSTEVSALFGMNPHLTEFELWHSKFNRKVYDLEGNERMRWGNRLESAIAFGAAEDKGWNIQKLNTYMRDEDARMGSSFDFMVTSGTGVPSIGLLEVKNVDAMVYKNRWLDDGANIEAPEHIELQVQHQMEVSQLQWAAIVALVGGNTVKIAIRKRDEAIGELLRDKVAAFWKRVDNGDSPEPDFARDAEFIIKRLHNTAGREEIIADEELDLMMKTYGEMVAERRKVDQMIDKAKARILERIGPARRVTGNNGVISCGMVEDSKGTLVTPDMVGTYIGARNGFRMFRYMEKK